MNLMDLFIKIGVDDQATSKISKITSSVGNGLKTAAKVGTAALGVAAAGITTLTAASIKQYAEYEQLVGGAQLMFGEAYETVAKNAQNAYQTVQMSQNEYLQQVNGFATGLKTALGGNAQAAADLAHKIVQAEADIIAATGNTAENVQNAFNGIMRSNFSMLDNLQIGITPTKEGFQEVIDKVNEWNASMGKMTEYQMGNLADMQSALVDYIEMVGMSGYAQMEASKTISGSLASLRSAWSNLITGVADDTADFGNLVENLVGSVGAFAENILPRIKIALDGAVKLIEGVFPIIIDALPGLFETLLPSIVTGAVNVLNSFVNTISDNGDMLISAATGAVATLVDGIVYALPKIVSVGLDLIISLANGIADSLPTLIPTVIDVVLEIVEILTDPETLADLLDAGLAIIMALADSLLKPETIIKLYDASVAVITNLCDFIVDNLDELLDVAIAIIVKLVECLLDPKVLERMFSAGVEIVVKLAGAIVAAAFKLGEAAVNLIGELINTFSETDWAEVGEAIIDGLLEGLQDAWDTVVEWLGEAWDDLVESLTSLFDDAEDGDLTKVPTSNARKIVKGATGALDAVGSILDSTSTSSAVYSEGKNVTVVQNFYRNTGTAADLMEEAVYRQQQAEMGLSY